jgi:hypothetical protein
MSDDCCTTTNKKNLQVRVRQYGEKYHVHLTSIYYGEHIRLFRGDIPLLIAELQKFAPPSKVKP